MDRFSPAPPSAVPKGLSELLTFYGIRPGLSLFGLGFAFCWCYSSQRLACNVYDGFFQIVQYVATALVCLAFFVLGRFFGQNCSTRGPVVVVGLLLAIASAPFIVIRGPWAACVPAVLAFAAVSGAIVSWLYMMWGQVYARLDSRQALACVCGSLVLSSSVKIFFDLLGHDAAGAIALAALPFASVACWRVASLQLADVSRPSSRFSPSNLRCLWSPCVGVFLIAMGVGMFMSLVSDIFELPIGFRIAAQVVTIVIAAGVFLGAGRVREALSLHGLWYVVIAVVASGLAVGVLSGVSLGNLSSSIFMAAQMVVIAFWWVALADIAHGFNGASDHIYGLGWGLFYAVPMALGLYMPHMLSILFDVQSLTVIVLWLLILALVYMYQRQAPDLRLFASFVPQVSWDTADRLQVVMDELAVRYVLTPKECEVLVLYAQGRSRSFISAQLVVSENTVRDHIKSSYKKLGIHSKQELIDLFA